MALLIDVRLILALGLPAPLVLLLSCRGIVPRIRILTRGPNRPLVVVSHPNRTLWAGRNYFFVCHVVRSY
jgi:hypothetical protein